MIRPFNLVAGPSNSYLSLILVGAMKIAKNDLRGWEIFHRRLDQGKTKKFSFSLTSPALSKYELVKISSGGSRPEMFRFAPNNVG